jgi:glutamate 5-kinase
LNARAALERLLQGRVVPIINENDTVSVEEIKFGDNDTLGAAVCGLLSSDVVVLLTGAAGLFTADPGVDPTAARVPVLHTIDAAARAMAGPPARFGTGGMVTKLDAARVAQRHGAATVIAPGRMPDVLARIFDGDDVGTLVVGAGGRTAKARKRWIATNLRPRGTLVVDGGAARALRSHASLLPVGVREVIGDFDPGDAVDVVEHGHPAPLARGLVQLSARDAREVAGMKTNDARETIEGLADEVIHRDDLVLL